MRSEALIADLEKKAQSAILILDGAMGTMLQKYTFSEEQFRGERFADWKSPVQGNNDLLNLTQPEAVRTIHTKFIEAGADLIETNTFSATTIAQV
ncbi:MAG: homocysteine S-methyltransferase family protein, partial [Henriciella sp.]|nr:homocysteine S-methyltransferase family protein [Henriciella sp.]